MYSQTAEYALRACVFLAMNPEQTCTTQQVSEATRVPEAYLSKVLQSLAKAGLLASQRGIRGGFRLVKPEELTVLEIINAVSPICRLKSCPLGLESHAAELCPMHKKLDATIMFAEEAFASTRLFELVQDNSSFIS